MKTLERRIYKKIEFELYTHKINDEFYFGTSCDGIGSKGNPAHINRGWSTSSEAIKDMENAIDDFLSITPKNFKELAEAIQSSLVWTDYEDCHVDPSLLEILINNFNKAHSK